MKRPVFQRRRALRDLRMPAGLTERALAARVSPQTAVAEAAAGAGGVERGRRLTVLQANKFELVTNAQTARMLGLTVPPTLLALLQS